MSMYTINQLQQYMFTLNTIRSKYICLSCDILSTIISFTDILSSVFMSMLSIYVD